MQMKNQFSLNSLVFENMTKVQYLLKLCFSTPTGLEDVSCYPQLLAAILEDPDWSEEDIKKLAGLNLLRVFSQVEQVHALSSISRSSLIRPFFHAPMYHEDCYSHY